MRFARFSLLLISLVCTQAAAFDTEDRRLYEGQGDEILTIISTADANVFEPIIYAFQAENPHITIDYTIASSTEVMHAISVEKEIFDLVISSAMDLQTKLANDGYAQHYRSDATDLLPSWAKWRNQLFAFTQEPAVMVISDDAFVDRSVPVSREQLITMLRENPEAFDQRIGTYDVRRSGAGYLFATQDSRNTDSFWRLAEVMGRLNVQLYSGSRDMITDVAEGRLALAYNVVGSYAISRLADTPGFRVIAFEDYLSVMLRTALIPTTAQNPSAAGEMVNFLASLNNRPELTKLTSLPPINTESLERNSAARVIRLGPGGLVFLDRLKKEAFLRSWENSIVQK
jgi:iron(III) transport system substrate-binding protein